MGSQAAIQFEHMKIVIFFTFLQSFFLVIVAQENESTLTINTINDDSAKLSRRAFMYREFTAGKVIFKDDSTAEAPMNYSLLSGKILFINPKGDTLEFAHPEIFNQVILGIDTFYYFDKMYLKKISHYPVNNLAISKTLKLIGREKKGAYGTYSGVSSTNSNTTFTNDDQVTTYIIIDENAVYKFSNDYFITDRFNNFFPANKKGFNRVFFSYEIEIKNYLGVHSINFDKQADLQQLLKYIQNLK